MFASAIGVAIIVSVGVWVLGGFLLRVAGVTIVLLGAFVLATSGSADGLVSVVIGFALWLGGHWHYALRHHEYKSPLAERVFCQILPGWLDPTRRWRAASQPPADSA